MPQTDRNVSLATFTHAGMYSLVWPFGMVTLPYHYKDTLLMKCHIVHLRYVTHALYMSIILSPDHPN